MLRRPGFGQIPIPRESGHGREPVPGLSALGWESGHVGHANAVWSRTSAGWALWTAAPAPPAGVALLVDVDPEVADQTGSSADIRSEDQVLVIDGDRPGTTHRHEELDVATGSGRDRRRPGLSAGHGNVNRQAELVVDVELQHDRPGRRRRVNQRTGRHQQPRREGQHERPQHGAILALHGNTGIFLQGHGRDM